MILANTPPFGDLVFFNRELVVMGQMNSGVPSCYKRYDQDSVVLCSRVWSRNCLA